MQIALALVITLVSATALNLGYLTEHSAVKELPPLTAKHPLASARLLLGSRRWLTGFGVEATGWLLYVLALALAPLSLVQATAAGGIGILAVMVARMSATPLSMRERCAVGTAWGGLALLGVSLAGNHGQGHDASYVDLGVWIGGSFAAAVAAVKGFRRFLGGGAAYGTATGLLFAAGDIATKSALEGGWHLLLVGVLIACYGFGTLVLQGGFQRSSPLVTAGIATLLTNAIPIAAGMTIFDEPLPDGWLGGVRIAAFAAVVLGAVFLAERKHGELGEGAESPQLATS
jgi:hypothetical protein